MANVKKDAWEESLKAYTEKSQNEGITHFLIPQSDGKRIVHAALIRIGSLCEIWLAQRSPLPRKKEDQPRISGMDEEWKKIREFWTGFAGIQPSLNDGFGCAAL